MARFTVNISGRVQNFTLPIKSVLMPLHEAVVNSFHAIEDVRNDNSNEKIERYIKIKAIRDEQISMKIDKEELLNPIHSFSIEDNGIGFNEENFESFLTSDSTHKISKGGKGIGRFAWLKAFNKVEIDSVFEDVSGEYNQRVFTFSLKDQEIEDSLQLAERQKHKTIVALKNYKDNYKEACNKNLQDIALEIVEHCVIYFLADECPKVTLEDDYDLINLNKLFKEKININTNRDAFYINDYEFELLHLKMYDPRRKEHRLHYSANDREVQHINLATRIPNLQKPLVDDQDEKYVYSCIITSDFLDSHLDANRLSFDIEKNRKGKTDLTKEPTLEDIELKAKGKIEEYLKDALLEIQEEKMRNFERFIKNEAPQYRHLLEYKKDEIAKIKPGTQKEKLDEILYGIKKKFERELEKQNSKIVKTLTDDVKQSNQYQEILSQHMKKVNDAGKATLAEYVSHRKTVIDLLDKGLRKKTDDSFNLEAFIHSIIFPMRVASNDIKNEQSNLWLIDEKLSYHYYLASDIALNNEKSGKRPDILICDRPIAVVDNNGPVYDSIVIFELKKPMRDNYSKNDDPIDQVYDYVEQIKEGKKDKYGRTINVNESTRFYLYILCDINDKIERFARRASLEKTPDGLGRYGYNRELKAYIEIIPYPKLVDDAQKRNKMLFEKLGL